MVNVKGGKKQQARLEAHIIGDEYPEYVLLELKRRLDYLHFSMLVLQKAGADKKTAARILAPLRKSLGKLLGIISRDAEKTISRINSIRPGIIVYERHPRIMGLDLARAEDIIRKEMPNIVEMKRIDAQFAGSVSRLLGIYQGYYLGMVSQAPSDTAPPKGASTGEFIRMVKESAPKARRIVLVTGRKNLCRHLGALRKEGFAVRTYCFADLARIRTEEKRLLKMSRLSWLKKSAAKRGFDRTKVETEFLRLANLFGVSRL